MIRAASAAASLALLAGTGAAAQEQGPAGADLHNRQLRAAERPGVLICGPCHSPDSCCWSLFLIIAVTRRAHLATAFVVGSLPTLAVAARNLPGLINPLIWLYLFAISVPSLAAALLGAWLGRLVHAYWRRAEATSPSRSRESSGRSSAPRRRQASRKGVTCADAVTAEARPGWSRSRRRPPRRRSGRW